jgi:hypothetical protein
MIAAGIAMGLDACSSPPPTTASWRRPSVAEFVVVLPLPVVTRLHHPLGTIGVGSADFGGRMARLAVNHQRVKGAQWQFSLP